MRLLYVADGRSPIARGWMQGFIEAGHEVHLATTYRCQPQDGLASLQFVPVAFSGRKRATGSAGARAAGLGLRTRLRQWLGPLTVPLRAQALREVVDRVQPDLVHALRIPFEGMLAAWVNPDPPLLVSSWGNDFTLHARSAPTMAWLTRRTLARTTALHADCRRDRRLAAEWGLNPDASSVVLPGNGGVPAVFFEEAGPLPDASASGRLLQRLEPQQPLIVQPRGFRAYVHNDAFFASLGQIFAEYPRAVVACPAMAGAAQAERWRAELGPDHELVLLGDLNQRQMAALLQRAWVVISPTEHDGTPNSLLEAMACGAVPVAGDLESVREWIVDGETGRLVDPSSPAALADAVSQVLGAPDWREQAAQRNRRQVQERAARPVVFQQAQAFYVEVLAAAV